MVSPSLASLLAAVLLGPQTAPGDDPVRVALYGAPVSPAIAQLVEEPAGHVGRAVRVRGRFSQAGADRYRVCADGPCLRLVPEEDLKVVLRARAPAWEGREIEVTGLFFREHTPGSGAAPAGDPFAVRFWRIRTPQAETAAPAAGEALTLETLVYAGGSKDGQLVRVRGLFRGRNLHGDLPPSSQRGRDDWLIKEDYYAVWVTGRPPAGPGWTLNPLSPDDTRVWLEVAGRPETRNGFVYLRAEEVAPMAAPVAAQAVAPAPAAARQRTPPPVLVFSLPLEGEDISSQQTRLLLQFSKQMDETSFAKRVRLRYAGEEASIDAVRVSYDAARRTLLVEPGAALTAGRELECLLLDGIMDTQGQGLIPRQGAILDGVVEMLRYRVGPAEEPASAP